MAATSLTVSSVSSAFQESARLSASASSSRDVGKKSSITLASSRSSHRGAAPILSLTLPPQPSKPSPGALKIHAAQDLAQQIKEMAAAEKRWESQVRDGKVKSLSPKEAGYAVDLSNYTLLDVRPSSERKKAWAKGSMWIPIYDVNKNLDPGSVLNKFQNFAMGGWWSGSPVMQFNGRFMPDVVSKVPKSANVIVGCQKGLRSLAACEQLYKAGYRNIFWLNGGFDATDEGDFQREGPQPFKFAGLGGLSEFLGWTDAQREASKGEGWGFRAMLFARLMVVVLGVDLAFVGAQQLTQYLQNLKQ